MKHLSVLIIILAVLAGMSCRLQDDATHEMVVNIPDKIDFNFHVRPILSDRCFACHGPDENARQGDLRLDLKAAAFARLDSIEDRYAIIPGDLNQSQLVKRISSTDPEVMMPPPDSKLSLKSHEIEILRRWIKQGAEWKKHWAFTLPIKSTPPKVSKSKWIQNPIDHFVFSRLEGEDLHPNPEASKEKLIRRLSFDFRGLPPTLQEIDEFLADDSEEAYEKVVDLFLNEESYGERMAMEWLDLARYADSHGYQDDLERSMWPWRDWVIDAFNQNMPYDQFVKWQLAGDLIPDATYDQKLATAFNRNHKITQEVGVIDEEYRVTYVLDRTNTFSTAFLGLTVECAQCHDHKYDPIAQKEYYSLFGFFNNVPEKGRVDYGVEVAEPYLPLPEEKITELRTYVENLVENQQSKLREYAHVKWSEHLNASGSDSEFNQTPSTLPRGLVAWYPLDFVEQNHILESLTDQRAEVINAIIPVPGKYGGGVELMGTNYANLAPTKYFDFNRPFSLSFWIKSLDGGIRGAILASLNREKKSNFLVSVTNDKNINIAFDNLRNKTKLTFISKATLPENKWAHISLTHDGSRKSRGVQLYMNGQLLEVYVSSDKLRGGVLPSAQLYLGTKNPIHENKGADTDQTAFFSGSAKGLQAGQLDELMFFSRPLSPTEIAELATFDPVKALENKKVKSEIDKKRLFYNDLVHQDANYQQLTERLREYKIREVRTDDIVVKPTMVMAEMDTIRPTHVLDRGQYDSPREEVNVGTPKAIMTFNEDYPKNRLGLAKWLFDTKNPLTARVAVNRYWQMLFGRGLVATPGDFGSQGSLPSHPALLDWLAVDFQESGWDIKELLRTIVCSATYRQSVKSNKRLQVRDPENIWLARGPAVRLSAEMVRDHALKIGGLLSPRVGGPSVKPYQPSGLWLQVASGNQTLRKYIQDHDQDLYRRSLYTFWKRTIPPPSMIVFDAPSREQCSIKRTSTSTPMQALVLLNDPQFAEASRLLAARMVKEGGETIEEHITFAFRLASSRAPSSEEIDLLIHLFYEEKSDFEENPEAASTLLEVGEFRVNSGISPANFAAYTVLANTILNTAESIMKG